MTTEDPSTPPSRHDEHGHVHLEGECTEVVRDLYLFLDQELDAGHRQLVMTHLEECSPCLEKFDFEVELRMVIAARNAQECPEPLRQRILGMLRDALPGEGAEWGSGTQPA
jgi:mycothiol system anti-sigma-R factor